MRRFFEKTAIQDDGCVNWTAYQSPQGYGRFKYAGKLYLAHRYAWEMFIGPIPDDMHVLHQCDNPSCINVSHLFLGTNAENVADRVRKGRNGDTGGAKPRKLTLEQAIEIVRSPGTNAELGKKFNVTHQMISRIQTGKAWPEAQEIATLT